MSPMVKKLLSRAEFARQAGVSGAAVTKACSSGILKAALHGKRVDASHPDAVKYIADKKLEKREPTATGLDPLYEDAVSFCQNNNVYSVSGLRREFKIGHARAQSIIKVMDANKLITKKAKHVVIEEGAIEEAVTKLKKPHVRGPAAAKETKKREAYKEDVIMEAPEEIREFGNMTLFELIEKFGTDIRFSDWLSATQKIESINEKRLKNAATEGELVSRDLVKRGILEPIDACHVKLLTDGAKSLAVRVMAMQSAGSTLEEIEGYIAERITSFIRPVKSKVKKALRGI